ncbi:hypothetical protein [Plesiocystis pacifica]|uniref:hypothetical protein n=1 Tax=Plesiocystis pacifica TaxID=191768 RepID=UPI0005D47DA4|nr:hypothetical protein [Plesiocystis pacifica]
MEAAVQFDACAHARREISRWYDVFYGWSRGLVEPDDRVIRQIWEALTPDFRVVLTDGRMLDRDEYWTRLSGLYGDRAGSPKSEVVNLVLRPLSRRDVLATFDLIKPGVSQKKFDTAILRSVPGQRYGMMWAYVHESAHEQM